MCKKNAFPVFDPALDNALLTEWLIATNTGEDLHALINNDFSQGFLMGRVLTMMEDQLEYEDEDQN